MDHATTRASDVAVLGFEDGLGRRYRVQTGVDHDVHLEILCFRPELTDIAAFEFALRERVVQLSGFQHASYARIRRVDRLNGGTLALFSESIPGARLSELLAGAERRGLTLDINTALAIVRQLGPAAAVLQQSAHVSNGALGPERVIVTPQARLVIAEFAIGAALEQLHYSRERYWQDLRVALPPSAGLPRFDEYADVAQLGMVALALILGRAVRADEYPGVVEDLVASATAVSERGDRQPLSQAVRSWLRRALQLDVRNSFRSPAEAQVALEQLLSTEDGYTGDQNSLTAFLSRYQDTASKPGSPAEPPLFATEPRIPEPQTIVTPQPTTVEPPRPSFTLDSEPVASPPAPSDFRSFLTDPLEVKETHADPRGSQWPELSKPAKESIQWLPQRPATEEPETEYAAEESHPRVRTKKKSSISRGWIAGAIGLALLAAAAFAGQRFFNAPSARVTTGTLSINSNPQGAKVLVDGVPRGQTPFNLSLPPGPHNVVVQGDSDPRTIPVTIVAGTTTAQYLELPKATAKLGMLQIWTDPSGARVIVDGQARGVTPLTLTDLTTGDHSVTLENDVASVNHKVTVVPGVPASLVVPLGVPQGAVVSGWFSVSAPIEMQLFEQNKLLGTSGIDRIMLPTGRHDIDIVNEAIGFKITRSVQVVAGKVSSISVTLPKGVVSLNALPWATVSIDGESVGETPIGNLSITIGPHEVVFRNPQLGEQRRVINVTTGGPVRLSIDLTKK